MSWKAEIFFFKNSTFHFKPKTTTNVTVHLKILLKQWTPQVRSLTPHPTLSDSVNIQITLSLESFQNQIKMFIKYPSHQDEHADSHLLIESLN